MGFGFGNFFSMTNEKLKSIDQAINQSVVGRFFRLDGSGHVRIKPTSNPLATPDQDCTTTLLSQFSFQISCRFHTLYLLPPLLLLLLLLLDVPLLLLHWHV